LGFRTGANAATRVYANVLLGGGADEAPEVYKRLPEVLVAHGGSVRVKHTLRPHWTAADVHGRSWTENEPSSALRRITVFETVQNM
jgi:hypothetical protein